MTIVRGIDSGRRNGGLMRPHGSLTPLTEARREVGNGRVPPASTPCAGLPMSAGCAMCVNGGETIVGGTGDGDPEFPGCRQAKTSEASSSRKHSAGSGMRGLIAILGALAAVPACAHDQWTNGAPIPAWVKASCCGPADAHHLTSDQVHRYAGYYRVDGYHRPIPIALALPSQDGDYWIFYRDKDGAPGVNGGGSDGQSGVYCFFVPMAF